MPYLTHARALELYGYTCAICDLDIAPQDAVYYDADLGEDDTPIAVVSHAHCHNAIERTRMVIWLQAANLARACGQDWLADKYVEHSQTVAKAMEKVA